MTGGPNPPSVERPQGLGNAPMLMACCAFSAGILWGSWNWSPPVWLVIGTLVAIVCGGLLLHRRSWRLAMLAICLAFALLGALAFQGNAAARPAAPLLQFATNQELELTGTVMKDATSSAAMYGGTRQSFDLAVDSVAVDGRPQPTAGGVRLSLYSKASVDDDSGEPDSSSSAQGLFRYGQRLRLRVKLNVPANFGNPGAFDYRHYLERNGIVAVGSGKLDNAKLIQDNGGTRPGYWRAQFRRAIVRRIHQLWPPQQAAILDAMLVGEDAYIGRDVRTDFQRSGTYHILVVSGFNVGILAFVVFALLRCLRLPEAWATIFILLLAVGYTYLTNAGAPIVRATLMLGVYLITRLLYRDRAALNAVGATALLLLTWDPESLFDPSFQLTFLSVIAIAGIVLPIVDGSSGPYRRAINMLATIGFDRSLQPRFAQFRLDLRMIVGRLARVTGSRVAYRVVGGTVALAIGLYETLLVSAVMQFALALPMAWYFHRATVSALAANALVVPLTALMLPAAIAALAVSTVSGSLATVAAIPIGWLLETIGGAVRLFGHMRINDTRVATPEVVAALSAAAALGFAIFALRQRHTWIGWASIVVLVVTSAWILTAHDVVRGARHGVLEITAIDVGQGDSILIITPEGKSILLDSGGMLNGDSSSFEVGEDVVSPYLWSRGITHLDVVAISHTHADHAGGMGAVIHNFRPGELWLPDGAPARERTRILEAAAVEGTKLIYREQGQGFDFGGAQVEVLGPPPGIDFGDKVRDDDAMALRISYEGHSFLAAGDIGKMGEKRLMAQGVHAELLKIAHHGSANASSAEFLGAVDPDYALISVGRRNTFRHPRPEVLARLAAAHVKTYRTDLFGAVRFEVSKEGVRVTQWVLSSPRR